jgi:hypothetical protein
MTSHIGPRLTAVAAILTVSIAAGCGSSGGNRAEITLIAPKDKAELTIDDDVDPDTAGVQVEVRAQTTSIKAGTAALLVIAGQSETYLSEVDDSGLLVFEKPTLPPGPHTFTIHTATGSVTSPEYSYTLKTLVIESPLDGQGIALGDDIDQDQEGLQINVTIKAYAVDGADDITLSVDDMIVGSPVSPDVHGVAVFKSVTFASGTHTLKAIAGNVESSETTISVNPACASVTWVTPRVPSGDRLTLPGGKACPSNGDDYTIDVEISTDAGDGRPVELLVNTTTKRTSTVHGSVAVFEDVPLNQRMSANKLSVTVQGASGVTCAPVPFPKDIFVDCMGSDCKIGAPVPYSGKDAAGNPALYLNRSMLNGKGFDVRVDSDSGLLGRQLLLIIDQRDGSALSEEGKANGNKVSATFKSVELSPGEHSIEARCEDASGNITESGEAAIVVDTDACEVEIQKPAADTLFLPDDDVDHDAANGVQIATESAITGGDCIGARAAICDPSEGISGSEFAEFDGEKLSADVKLGTDAEQTLCVEARDRADNESRASVNLKFRSVLPNVRIESPTDQTRFNAAGNDGLVMDSNPGTTACDADFRVLCSEVGAQLQLRRNDAQGPVVATGTCEPRAGGDPELPEGYNGRAKLDDVAFLAPGKHEATLVATQTVQGSTESLVGASEPMTMSGWCELPPVTLIQGCPAEQIEIPGSGKAQAGPLTALYLGQLAEAPMEATLTVTDPGGTEISSQTAMLATDRYKFNAFSLGETEQMVATKIVLTDMFANTTTVTCPTMVVSDLPALSITSPVHDTIFGPTGGCGVGVADKFGLPVAITLDQTSDRELSYSVNSGSSASLPITSTSMNPCIPVGDGANTVTFQLKSTISVGVAQAAVSVTANVLQITTPAANATLSNADDACDPGFGAHVVADVAPGFEGAAATVSQGSTQVAAAVSSGKIDTCLPSLPRGTSTLTVSLDGKSISRGVNVTVTGSAPSSSIMLTSVTQPPDNAYRSSSVTLGWSAPTEDYPGQLKAYELRCATSELAETATPSDKDTWWNAAKPIMLAGNVVPPATSAAAGIRIGESLHCVLRARDGANQLSPISGSAPVSYPFREQRVDVSEFNSMGYALASIGDVNDDGINDVLVGGTGRAYLYFGNSAGLAAKVNAGAPDVTFRGAPGASMRDLGSRVAALGDIDGDGENDFAISHPSWSATSPSSIGLTGAVYVFYGRKSSDQPWPSDVDLTSTSTAACGADVCFYGEVMNELLGGAIAPAGDFNNDGRPDIALSASARSTSDPLAGRQYVLLGRAFHGGGSRPGTFWNAIIRLPSSDPAGFYVDGVATGVDATSNAQMGIAVAAVGNTDGMPGGDLLISSLGRMATSITAKLYFLSGRSHDGSAPQLKAIPNSELVFKAGGTTGSFGARLAPLRNFYDATESGVADVAVFEALGDTFYVYLGDKNGSSVSFANDTRLVVQGPSGSAFGNAGLGAGRGYNPSISNVSRSDIDGDGLDDLCIGSGLGTRPINIFYGADVDDALSGNQLNAAAASQVQFDARPGTVARSVQPVGDITGDGAIDLVVGEPDANSNAGGITILY